MLKVLGVIVLAVILGALLVLAASAVVLMVFAPREDAE